MKKGVPVSPGVAVARAYCVDEVLARREPLKLDEAALSGEISRFDRACAAVAEGNRRVYAEIAPPFARFIDWFGLAARPDPERLQAFLSDLRGGPVTDRHADGRPGQDLLRAAFRNYYRARWTRGTGPADVKERQEYTFLATAQVALHEQNHLQDAIARAMPSLSSPTVASS